MFEFDADRLPMGFHCGSLERTHLMNLAEIGHIEDERGRNIEARLEELTAYLPVDCNTYEDRLRAAMSRDWETIWVRRPLYDNETYDGGDIVDPPAPYDYELGKVVRLVSEEGRAVMEPPPWYFIGKGNGCQFMTQLRSLCDRHQWLKTKLSKNPETGAYINNHLKVLLPLPAGYRWPDWAIGLEVFLFGTIVDTRWCVQRQLDLPSDDN